MIICMRILFARVSAPTPLRACACASLCQLITAIYVLYIVFVRLQLQIEQKSSQIFNAYGRQQQLQLQSVRRAIYDALI